MNKFPKRTDTVPDPNASAMKAKSDVNALLSGDKKSMADVNYTQAGYASVERCSECKYYIKPGEKDSPCDLVVGIVSADGICDLYEARTSGDESSSGVKITIEIG